MDLCRFYFIYVSVLLFAAAAASTRADETSDYLTQIRVEATAFLNAELAKQSPVDTLKITISTPDPRLQLKPCDNDLTYALHGNSSNASNVTVKVSCHGGHSWAFYITARVERYQQVAIAVKNLMRGVEISDADIIVEHRLVQNAGSSGYSNADSTVGMMVKRSIRAGDILRSSSLSEPLAIRKGDQIKIRATDGNLVIVTTGMALAEGRIGEQIKVRNIHSKRIIKAKITDIGQVDVVL